MHVHNLYCDADGQSHFRDIEIELHQGARAFAQLVLLLLAQLLPNEGFHQAERTV